MPPSLVERGGVSVPDGHDPPPSAQDVGFDDLSRVSAPGDKISIMDGYASVTAQPA